MEIVLLPLHPSLGLPLLISNHCTSHHYTGVAFGYSKSPGCITVCSSLSQLLNNFQDKIYFKLLCSLYCNLSFNYILSAVCDFACKYFKLCPFFANQHLRYVATGQKGPSQDGGCRATFVLFCCASPALLLTQKQVTNTRSVSSFHFAASQRFLKQVTLYS